MSDYSGIISAVASVATLTLLIHLFIRLSPTPLRGGYSASSAMALCVSLLLIVNANQLAQAGFVFAIAFVMALTVLLASVTGILRAPTREHCIELGGMAFAGMAACVGFAVLFEVNNFWLLEATNNDALVFYQGLWWINENPTLVSKGAVANTWGLGTCGQGASWVGLGCVLHRGGTYTLLGWLQQFDPSPSASALFLLPALIAMATWPLVGMAIGQAKGRHNILARAGLTVIVVTSTGFISALSNSNFASALGGMCVMATVATAIASDLSFRVRLILFAMWCALASHVYSEAIFYCGLFAAAYLVVELPSHFRRDGFRKVIKSGLVSAVILAAFGNVGIYQSIVTLSFVSEAISHASGWHSWYMHQSELLWPGAFIAGNIVGTEQYILIAIVGAILATITLVSFLTRRDTRGAGFGALVLAVSAVVHLELSGYEYGEHKIIQIIGPAFTLMLAFLIWKYIERFQSAISPRRHHSLAGAIILTTCIFFVNLFEVNRVSELFDGKKGRYAISYPAWEGLASNIRPGDTVLVDDLNWIDHDRFRKSHFAIFEVHRFGGEAVLPAVVQDWSRGGYFRASRGDTFQYAENIDWILSARGRTGNNSVFFDAVGNDLIFTTADFQLSRKRIGAAVAPSNGWHACEQEHCWTMGPFGIESRVWGDAKVTALIEIGYFSAPADGVVTVKDQDGKVLVRQSAALNKIRVVLPPGFTAMTILGDWEVRSPQSIGVSGDPRPLFARVESITLLEEQ